MASTTDNNTSVYRHVFRLLVFIICVIVVAFAKVVVQHASQAWCAKECAAQDFIIVVDVVVVNRVHVILIKCRRCFCRFPA